MTFESRIKINRPFTEVIDEALIGYGLNSNNSQFEIIQEGYDDLNCLITCPEENYVIKFFNKEKNLETITSYLEVMKLIQNVVDVPKLINLSNGRFLGEIADSESNKTHFSLFQYFEGQSLEVTGFNKSDLIWIIESLARLHQVPIKPFKNYDSWGSANLLSEYPKKSKYLNSREKSCIEKILENFAKVNFEILPKSIIHGDIQKKHVLKSQSGERILIDWGCSDFNSRIFDIGIFFALFEINDKSLQGELLNYYQKINPLKNDELTLIDLIMQATFAMYLMSSKQLISEGDDSKQTKKWYEFGYTNLAS